MSTHTYDGYGTCWCSPYLALDSGNPNHKPYYQHRDGSKETPQRPGDPIDFGPAPIPVRKIGAWIPMSEDVAMDHGLIPDTRPPYVPEPEPWHYRPRRWVYDHWWRLRERLGYWIAGHYPKDDDW